VHYQLAQAYQRLGRAEVAQKEFDAYRALKDKRRGGGRVIAAYILVVLAQALPRRTAPRC